MITLDLSTRCRDPRDPRISSLAWALALILAGCTDDAGTPAVNVAARREAEASPGLALSPGLLEVNRDGIIRLHGCEKINHCRSRRTKGWTRAAPRARSTMFLRTARISPCAYSSFVNMRWYGSYRNAGMVGLAIIIASRWNRPSDTNTMASGTFFEPVTAPSVGAVHPSTSPGPVFDTRSSDPTLL